MSSQITNNNYMTAPTFPNPYITRKLKGIEAMINIQKQVQNMMKIAEETNIMITEMEEIIMQASINN